MNGAEQQQNKQAQDKLSCVSLNGLPICQDYCPLKFLQLSSMHSILVLRNYSKNLSTKKEGEKT
jgi:hypothetical protein